MSKLINASKIWAVRCDENTKYVCVKKDVANLTNREVVIRVDVGPGYKTGLYNITMNGGLTRVIVDKFGYPDIDLLEPNWEEVKTACKLSREMRDEMVKLCRAAKLENDLVTLSKDGMYVRSYPNQPITFQYPFGVYPEVTVNPSYLEIALTTFREYSILAISREPRTTAPLIVGTDWGNCALLAPINVK
jgi:hypothetical protein